MMPGLSDKLDGLLLIDKPAGISSAQAVNRLKRCLPRGTKLGHAGTLDPFATGLLVVLVGKATKRCEAIMAQPKTYLATIKLGATTATDDPESPEMPAAVREDSSALPGADHLRCALRGFVGQIAQVPPRYSAIKLDGRRACDRVRAGQQVQLQARTVHVYAIELLEYDWPLARVRVECGRGTYVRALARDLGEKLGVGGYLTQLRRTRIGPYDVSDAIKLDAAGIDLPSQLIPLPPA